MNKIQTGLLEKKIAKGAQSKKLSILLVSFNTRNMTLACIRSVFEQTSTLEFEVIVVDNCSVDGSADAIERKFPNVRLVRSRDNLGFARANNMAAHHATGEFILLLNPDTVVLDHAIERLVKFAEANRSALVWGGRTLFADGSLNPTSCWRFMTLWSIFCQAAGLSSLFKKSNFFNSESYGNWMRDTEREVDFVTGCFLLIKREFWEKLSGFDERFFMYAEEADLCFRANQLGARPRLTPHATIIHYGGASEIARAAKLDRMFAAKITFMQKHWAGWKVTIARLFLCCHVLLRFCCFRLVELLGLANGQRRSQIWMDVWQSRKSWLDGYAVPTGSNDK